MADEKEMEKPEMAEEKGNGASISGAWTAAGIGAAVLLLGGGYVAVNAINNNRRFDQMNYSMATNAANQGFILNNTDAIRAQNVAAALQAQKDYYTPRTSGHYLYSPWDGYGYPGQGNGARYGTLGSNSPITTTNNRSMDGSLIQP